MAVELTLLSAAAAGNGPTVDLQIGGDYMFAVNGTFGGTSVTLHILGPDGVNFISMGASATFTAAGICVVSIPPGKYRAVVTGGAAMVITATLKGIS